LTILESSTEQRVKEWADKHGIMNAKLTPMGQRGYPDRAFFRPKGRLLIIEFKRVGEKPGKLQKYIMSKLHELGYDVRWTDNADTAIGWLREM
jgi:hypothetical protein